jgi:hypothetical protein
MLATLPQKKTLATEIRRLLVGQFGGSPTRFGDAVGASRTTVYDWLGGAMPQAKHRRALQDLGIDPSYFVRPDARKRLTELEHQMTAGLREIQAIREQLEPGSGQ